MEFIHHSKVNREIVNQLEESHSKVKFEDPVFDHHERLEKYVETLKHEDENMRESMIKRWIDPMLSRVLDKWQSKFSFNSNIIKNAMSEKATLEEERLNNEIKIKKIEHDMDDYHGDVTQLEEKIIKGNDKLLEGKVNWKAERLKVLIFIPAALLIAVFTFYSYLDSNKDYSWMESSIQEKQMAIQKLAFDDNLQEKTKIFQKYYSTYIEKGEKIIKWDDEKMSTATSRIMSMWDYIIVTDGEAILYGLSALILLLGGKIISIIYERTGHQNLFFYIVSSLALILVISSITVKTMSKTDISKSQKLFQQIILLKESINQDSKGGFALQSISDDSEKSPDELKLEELVNQKKIVDESAAFIKSLNIFIMFLAEVLVGAVAWMVLADYYLKQTLSNGGSEGLLKNLHNVKNDKHTKVSDLATNRQILLDENILAAGLISRLGVLLANIESTSDIQVISDSFKRQEISYANQLLSAAVHRWKEEAIA